jgi:NADH:ubiquinone oxidoreductase subunit 6 (subunit J)
VTKIIAAGVLCGILIGTGWLVSSDGAGVFHIFPSSKSETENIFNNNSAAPTKTVLNAEDLKTEVAEITQNQGDAKNLFKDYSETQKLSVKLYSKYIFAIEVLGVVMLVGIVGAVALARSKGGTHHVVRRP